MPMASDSAAPVSWTVPSMPVRAASTSSGGVAKYGYAARQYQQRQH